MAKSTAPLWAFTCCGVKCRTKQADVTCLQCGAKHTPTGKVEPPPKPDALELEEEPAPELQVELQVEPPAAEYVATSSLVPWAQNPHAPKPKDVREIARSIERFGFGAPIVARRANREIIKGHARHLAAQRLKLTRVPVRFLDLGEDEAHLLALADNKIASNRKRDWGDEDVEAIMAELEARDVDVTTGSGFGDAEVDKLLAEADDPTPEAPKAKEPHARCCAECRARVLADEG